jgi:cell division topological specificity factor
MRWLSTLGIGKSSAKTAKDRLQIIIAQQRSEEDSPDYLPMLKKEIIKVIAKYTNADLHQIQMEMECKDNNSVLELNVVLPEVETTA